MKTTMYVQIEPEFTSSGRLSAARAKRVTQRRPDYPLSGSLVVKLILNIPDEAYLPLQPAAEIDIPIDHTEPAWGVSAPEEELVES